MRDKIIEDTKDLLTYQNISCKLETKIMGNNIVYFNTIDSTNNYAKKIALQELEGTIWLKWWLMPITVLT